MIIDSHAHPVLKHRDRMFRIHAAARVDDKWPRSVAAAAKAALHRLDKPDILGHRGIAVLPRQLPDDL